MVGATSSAIFAPLRRPQGAHVTEVFSADAAVAAPSQPNRLKQLTAASVGNAVEWFDWYVYSMLASTSRDNSSLQGARTAWSR